LLIEKTSLTHINVVIITIAVIVHAGVLQHTDGKYETVAIKVLKDHTNSEAKEDFMREVEIMTYFRHPNILTLIGVCPQGNITLYSFHIMYLQQQ